MRHFLCATALVLLPCFAVAQNVDFKNLFIDVPVSESSPGARALAMGGAFVAQADDATAADVNPAGLTVLSRPEVSVEYRSTETTQRFLADGFYPEDFSVLEYDAKSSGVPFASLVFPKGRFVGALYYSEPLDYQSDVNLIFGIDPFGDRDLYSIYFFLGPNGLVTQDECFDLGIDCQTFSLFPNISKVEMTLRDIGASAGFAFTDQFSVGVALRYRQFEESAVEFTTDPFFQPLAVVAQYSDDSDLGFTIGARWQSGGGKLAVGLAYRSKTEFDTEALFGSFDTDLNMDADVVGTPKYIFPSSISAGLSWRVVPNFRVNFDINEIRYSETVDKFFSLFNQELATSFYAEDGTEYRAGIEYFLTPGIIPAFKSAPIVFRLGAWREPAKGLIIDLEDIEQMTGNAAATFMATTTGRTDERDHYTGGIGFAFPYAQLDFGFDHSDGKTAASVTTVLRF